MCRVFDKKYLTHKPYTSDENFIYDQVNFKYFCFSGGSIVAPRLVSSAAHCFHNVTIPTDPNYARRIGEVHIGQLGLTEQGQRIAEWIKMIIPEKYLPFRPHDYS
jgi:hypothetical protein